MALPQEQERDDSFPSDRGVGEAASTEELFRQVFGEDRYNAVIDAQGGSLEDPFARTPHEKSVDEGEIIPLPEVVEVMAPPVPPAANDTGGLNGGASIPSPEQRGENIPTLRDEVFPRGQERVIPTLTEVVPPEELPSLGQLRQAETVLPPINGESLPASSLESELLGRGATQEEITTARIIEGEVNNLSPEKVDSLYRNLHKLEIKKNEAFAGIYGWVSKQFGDEGIESTKGAKGTMARFLYGLGSIYKERNQDIERKIAQLEEAKEKDGATTATQKLAMTGYVTGGLLRYGRMVSDVVGWTAAAPARFYIFGTTAAEGAAKAATEARLKNEEVINETRIEDPEKAAEEAWALYEEAMRSAGTDENGEQKEVSAKDLQQSYNERMPKDILDRLQKNPKEGNGERMVSWLARKHIHWLAARTEKKLEAINADPLLDDETKERMRQRELEGWGKLKMFQEYDRMLSQQGAIDSLAATGVLTQYVAKGASLGLMAQGAKALYDRLADVLADGTRLAVPPVVGTMGSERESAMEVEIPPEAVPQAPKPPVAKIPEEIKVPDSVAPSPGIGFSGDPDFYEDGAVPSEQMIEGIGFIPYTVAPGDTMIGILSQRMPQLEGYSQAEKEAKILEVLRKMSPDELRDVGIMSENPDIIRPGESIDLGKLSRKFSFDVDALARIPSGVSHDANGIIPPQVSSPSVAGGGTPSLLDGRNPQFNIPSESEPIVDRGGLIQTADRNPQFKMGEGLREKILVPERSISDLSGEKGEITSWPKTKPMPWPVNEEEAQMVFGKQGERSRQIAENMKGFLGRYPNQEEHVYFSRIKEIDEKVAASLLMEMRNKPMSRDDIEKFLKPYADKGLLRAPEIKKMTESLPGTPLELDRVKDPDVAKAVQIFYQRNGRAPTEEETARTYLEFFGKKSGGVVNLYDRQAGPGEQRPGSVLREKNSEFPRRYDGSSIPPQDSKGNSGTSTERVWKDAAGTVRTGPDGVRLEGQRSAVQPQDPTQLKQGIEAPVKNPELEALSREYPRVGIPQDPLVFKHRNNPVMRQMFEAQEQTLASIEEQYKSMMYAQEEMYRQGVLARRAAEAANQAAQRQAMIEQGIAGIRGGGNSGQAVKDAILQYGLGKITEGMGKSQQEAQERAQYEGAIRSLREQFAQSVRSANQDFTRRISGVARQIESQSKN